MLEKLLVFLHSMTENNMSSNTNVHPEFARYMLMIFKCTIVLTCVPENKIKRHASFLVIFVSLPVGIFSKKCGRVLMPHMI